MTSRHRRCACRTVLLLTGLLSVVTCLPAVRADEHSAHQPPVVRDNSRGLVIDVGRFLPTGRNVRVLIGRRTSGRRRLRVDVDRPGRSGVHVDVTVPADRSGRQTDDQAIAPVPADLGPADMLPVETPPAPDVNRLSTPGEPPVRAPKPHTAVTTENYIGLFATPLPAALRTQLAEKVSAGEGLLVTHIVPRSPAAHAGIKPYDILVTYDGRSIPNAAELKRLITVDKPGRSVVLEIIRSARRQTVSLVLGVRTPLGPRRQTFRLGTVRGSRWIRFHSRQAIAQGQVRSSSLPVAVSGKPATVTAVRTGRSSNGEGQTPATARRASYSFSIRSDQNHVCRLHVRYVDKEGKAVQRHFHGTVRSVRTKVVSLPPGVRSRVMNGLKEINRDGRRRPTFRFHLQPSIQGGRQVLRLVIGRTTSDQVNHLFQLEQTLAGRGQFSVDDLLKNDALTAELKQLSPTVRGKLIATLQRVRFPTILVKVRNSL